MCAIPVEMKPTIPWIIIVILLTSFPFYKWRDGSKFILSFTIFLSEIACLKKSAGTILKE